MSRRAFIDTQVAFWLAKGDSRLNALALKRINSSGETAMSALSIAELEITEPGPSRNLVAEAMILAGAVVADLGIRCADVTIVAAGRLGGHVEGRAPLQRMLGYVSKLRSMPRGLGQVHMRPAGFAQG